MKKWMQCVLLSVMLVLLCGMSAQDREEVTIKNGVFAETVDLAGRNERQATEAVEAYVEELKSVTVTVLTAEDHRESVTVGELGIRWTNLEIISEAAKLGTEGNVIRRYKVMKDLEHEKRVFDLAFDFDRQAIETFLTGKCTQYDHPAVNAFLNRVDGRFEITEGQPGYMLDVASSVDVIYEYLMNDWKRDDTEIKARLVKEAPKGTREELMQVKDLLGSFTTSYATSASSRRANVENGCRLINGTTLYPGEEFSTYQTVSPFSEENGYYMAGSYVNGKVVDSLGGGICQVSTTLYNAVLLSELEVVERHNHSMIVSYVEPSCDAAISESTGKDFKFVNNTDYPIYIEGYTADGKITFNIYGKETRDRSRKVSYESQILEEIKPASDTIHADASHAIGYLATDSAHIGYKAKLWKVVCEDGVEVDRTEVNSSVYKMVPGSATVGVATDNPESYEEIMDAIGTGSVSHVRNVINQLTTQASGAQ